MLTPCNDGVKQLLCSHTLRAVRLVATLVALAGFVPVLLRCRSAIVVDVAGFALPASTLGRRPCPADDSASTCVTGLVRAATHRDCSAARSRNNVNMDLINKQNTCQK